jgi:hypothetical protein
VPVIARKGRPEDLVGLPLDDLRKDPYREWYLNIIDRPCVEDRDFSDDEPVAKAPKREIVAPDDDVPESRRPMLKTAASVCRVPGALEFIELGCCDTSNGRAQAPALSHGAWASGASSSVPRA